ncbi:polyphosphate:AMP phosphotransferase [Oribacterium sp. WCC10]|uniref:polyphosphate:AMP phosphotransferase n=1 Tax=Oribacterium sp. WCC10 TaxID=1855343 RepID=UPI0008E99477|nr:polyphosphate:AMP phosphotransferase [Oribacterium sp. WCC10]SFG63962.1 polyphosphate:AMP phosphotransferase [Oribacterium sp. WCC10]
MIETYNSIPKPETDEIVQRLEIAHQRLQEQQLLMKENKLPVFILFEGWGTAGKGTVLGKLLKNLDPRFFEAKSIHDPSKDEKRKPFLTRYYTEIPEAGQFKFLDSGWMTEITKDVLFDRISKVDYKNRISSVLRFERSLTDNGYLVLKFFFHMSHKEQSKRINALMESKETAWQVDEYDVWENKHYDECYKVFDKFMEETNTSTVPWNVIDAKSRKWAELQVIETIVAGIDVALKNHSLTVPLIQNIFPLKRMPKLKDINLNKSISEDEYKTQLKELQEKLENLHNVAYLKGIPIIIAYEGWDAAGKGGNIKRVTAALDPRGYVVHPIASPKPHEKSRHHLWRFWTRLPKTGHFAIFDRTWYGRVMVERLEGYCTENDWQRAYNELNEFEKELSDWGAVIVKFWVHIDKDTQLARFTDRQNTPEKQWKITDEDWRNRDKWDLYEQAVDEMIAKTSTTYAPWHILESNDKKYARIKALKIICAAMEKKIKESK